MKIAKIVFTMQHYQRLAGLSSCRLFQNPDLSARRSGQMGVSMKIVILERNSVGEDVSVDSIRELGDVTVYRNTVTVEESWLVPRGLENRPWLSNVEVSKVTSGEQ